MNSNFAFAGSASCLDLPACVTSVSADKAKSKTCKDDLVSNCFCEELSCHKSQVASTCPAGWTDKGNTVSGKKCCYDMKSECAKKLSESVLLPPTQIPSNAESGEAIAGPSQGKVFFGFVDGVALTPLAGRAAESEARLDICLGSSMAEEIKGMFNDPYSRGMECVAACDNPKRNLNCRNKNAEVCKDRCGCVFQIAPCTNL